MGAVPGPAPKKRNCGGINKFLEGTKTLFPRSRERRPKKRSLPNIFKKSILAHEFLGDDQYFGGLKPRTALQWHRACYFLGHNFRLGGQLLYSWNFRVIRVRGGVEVTRLEAKTKDTKKNSEAKAKAWDSLSEDRPSRGQGQECSRTKDTGASVLKKTVF